MIRNQRITLIFIVIVILLSNSMNRQNLTTFAHPEAGYAADFISSGLMNATAMVSNSSHIVIADTLAHQIKIYDLSGNLVDSFPQGPPGIAPGELARPVGVSLNNTHIFVTEESNGRVSLFDSSGQFVSIFTSGFIPTGITNNGTHIFIIESPNLDAKVRVFDLNGNHVDTFGNFGPFELDSPYDIKVNSTHLFVTDKTFIFNSTHRISIFSLSHSTIDVLGFNSTCGICFQFAGSGPGEFNGTRGIEISDEYIFVADSNNQRVQVFNHKMEYLSEFGSMGNGNGQFKAPTGIVYNGSHIFVLDEILNSVQIFKFPLIQKTVSQTVTETEHVISTDTITETSFIDTTTTEISTTTDVSKTTGITTTTDLTTTTKEVIRTKTEKTTDISTHITTKTQESPISLLSIFAVLAIGLIKRKSRSKCSKYP